MTVTEGATTVVQAPRTTFAFTVGTVQTAGRESRRQAGLGGGGGVILLLCGLGRHVVEAQQQVARRFRPNDGNRKNDGNRCYSSQGFRAIQSVYTTAATRAATWSTAPVYCPFRVNYKVHTQLTLRHYCGYSTVVPSYHTPTLLVHID